MSINRSQQNMAPMRLQVGHNHTQTGDFQSCSGGLTCSSKGIRHPHDPESRACTALNMPETCNKLQTGHHTTMRSLKGKAHVNRMASEGVKLMERIHKGREKYESSTTRPDPFDNERSSPQAASTSQAQHHGCPHRSIGATHEHDRRGSTERSKC